MIKSTPNVFISYSHDSEDHKDWVYKLACKLIENGVTVVLDQWDVQLGSNLMSFMEKGLSNSDRVLVICTDNYNKKSNNGLGGVGYEKLILTAELFQNQDTTKFIPCIKNVTAQIKTPISLSARTYIDFSNDSLFEQNFNQLIHELYGVPLKPKPKLGNSPFLEPQDQNEALPRLGNQLSTVFFSNRFGKAFPGVRGIQWFKNPQEAIERLSILFKAPYFFEDATPIWWWRNGDMHIDSFEILGPDTILIDHQEFIIDEIAAVNAGEYYQSFVYIRTKASKPTGLYDHSIQDQIDHWGYAWEEFGLFREQPIRRGEYDDGAAVINGKVVDLGSEAVIRTRYTTPYNLIIAPLDSPINNGNFDQQRNQLLNGILKNENSLEDLTAEILKLPKREKYYRD